MPDVTVIEIPPELKAVGDAMREMITRLRQEMKGLGGGKAVDYAAVERRLGDSAASIERAAHAALLREMDVNCARVVVGGRPHARVGRCEATYYTLSGPVSVVRSLYRALGERNAKVVDAISLRAGVVAEGWLPETARAMAFLLQQGTSREAEATARQMGRLPYSRSSFERVGHAVGRAFVAAHEDVEDALIDSEALPEEARSISVSLDRVSVPMEEPRPRGVGRPRKDAPKRPVARNYRMAYCATVTLHDAQGAALRTLRYGRMPQGDPDALCERLRRDVQSLLRKDETLEVTLLLDGAKELWDLLDRHINAETIGKMVHRFLDLWHVLEKLGRAAVVMHGEANAPHVVSRWRVMLLNSKTAAEQILDELVRSGLREVRVLDSRPVHEAITYLNNHLDRLLYVKARRAGLPLGSGNVEATCKSLMAVRLKRCGARWKEESGADVVHLRALALSDRWDEGISIALRPLRIAVRRAA